MIAKFTVHELDQGNIDSIVTAVFEVLSQGEVLLTTQDFAGVVRRRRGRLKQTISELKEAARFGLAAGSFQILFADESQNELPIEIATANAPSILLKHGEIELHHLQVDKPSSFTKKVIFTRL